mgnify:CR=1 FL=1
MILKLIFIILLFLNNYNIEKLENINYHGKLIDNLQIYVIHYTPLKERKIIIEKQLNQNSLNYNFIEEFDKENLSFKDLKIFDTNKVKLSMCSNIIKHIQAYKKIMNSNYKFNLIFEDDVILNEYFNETLYKGLKQLPNNYDMLFIGSGANLHIPKSMIIPNKLIYKKSIEPTSWGGNGATRCTDSYLVSKKCAKKLIKYVSKLRENNIKRPSDFWLNEVIRDLKLEIYWLEPTIVIQGTETGKYKSSH